MINSGIDGAWPDEVRRSLEAFRQGHLIRRPPFFYAARVKHAIWKPTKDMADAVDDEEAATDTIVDVEYEQRPPYGAITSQTCDIAEERPDPAQPWVQVAPVYQCPPGDPLREREFVIPLDPPDVDGDGWIADLRVEFPLEKSLLAGEDPIEAFSSEEEYDQFGELLARRRGRPALHSVFSAILNGVTREMKQESGAMRGKARRVRDSIYALKLNIQDGTRLHPNAARLYVVTRGEPTDEAKEWFEDWWNRARLVAQEQELELLPIQWLNADDLEIDLETYEGLVSLRNPLHT